MRRAGHFGPFACDQGAACAVRANVARPCQRIAQATCFAARLCQPVAMFKQITDLETSDWNNFRRKKVTGPSSASQRLSDLESSDDNYITFNLQRKRLQCAFSPNHAPRFVQGPAAARLCQRPLNGAAARCTGGPSVGDSLAARAWETRLRSKYRERGREREKSIALSSLLQ